MIKTDNYDSAITYAKQITGITPKATAQTLPLPSTWTPETRNGVATGVIDITSGYSGFPSAIGIQSGYAGVPAAIGSVVSGAVGSLADKLQPEEWIIIPNWQSHTVKLGEIYEFKINFLDFFLQSFLKSGWSVKQIELIQAYASRNQNTLIRIVADYIYSKHDRTIGNLRDNIQIDYEKSRVDFQNMRIYLVFKIIKNFWQLAIIGAVIIGLFLATKPIIEEVRLLIRGYQPRTAVAEAAQKFTWLIIAAAILFFVLGKTGILAKK